MLWKGLKDNAERKGVLFSVFFYKSLSLYQWLFCLYISYGSSNEIIMIMCKFFTMQCANISPRVVQIFHHEIITTIDCENLCRSWNVFSHL